jgi:predicted transposase/invertase (TIGR01784 family)
MKHRIDPKIDCVFKALLGSLENRNLLLHFLNAILSKELPAPLSEVDILNPYNEKEFLDDKLSIVDVKAQDAAGRMFQIEIQMLAYRHLPARMLYTWADIYSQQLQSGQDYHLLKPTYAIWLLAENLLQEDANYAHDYKFREAKGRVLVEHGGLWLLEIEKFIAERVESEEQRWLKLFKEGEQIDDDALPLWMQTQEMRQAMNTLRQFSEKEHDYHAYQARQNFLREQRTLQWEREQLQAEYGQLRDEREQERMEKEQALKQLEAALRQAEVEAQRAEIEAQRAEIEAQRAEAALLEIERLKALLESQNHSG